MYAALRLKGVARVYGSDKPATRLPAGHVVMTHDKVRVLPPMRRSSDKKLRLAGKRSSVKAVLLLYDKTRKTRSLLLVVIPFVFRDRPSVWRGLPSRRRCEAKGGQSHAARSQRRDSYSPPQLHDRSV